MFTDDVKGAARYDWLPLPLHVLAARDVRGMGLFDWLIVVPLPFFWLLGIWLTLTRDCSAPCCWCHGDGWLLLVMYVRSFYRVKLCVGWLFYWNRWHQNPTSQFSIMSFKVSRAKNLSLLVFCKAPKTVQKPLAMLGSDLGGNDHSFFSLA